MTNSLQGRTILLVEDEYMLATDLLQELKAAGAIVIGPVPDVTAALNLLDGSHVIDGAVLDIKLGGKPSFPIADVLASRRIPYLFSTGYDRQALPEQYQAIPRCEKPVTPESIRGALASLLQVKDESLAG
jgi:CheY-like chemotaxis protein